MTRRELLVRHPLTIIGAVVTTVSAVFFIALVIAAFAGMFANPYAGLVVFIAIPALFVLGLLLFLAGVLLQQRKLRRDPNALIEWPVLDFRRGEVRRGTLLIAALTAVNLVIVLLAGYGSLHWMETPSFCGRVCHTPMQPQLTAWRVGPHAHVACVNCHIGEGARGFVRAKLSGVRQLVQVATTSYPRPIPPGAHMPAGAQAATCISCHQPGRGGGDHIRVYREYTDDETNTETLTVLQMHFGGTDSSGRSIHWHGDPAVRIEYVSTDAANETIPYVRVTDANGQVKEYVASDANEQAIKAGTRRMMDCVDCHNTTGHPIAQTPEGAVDTAIADGRVSRDLPYAKREAVRLLTATYPSQDEGANAIEKELKGFYSSNGGAKDPEALARAISALQDVYRHNVFPTMKVAWGSYVDNRGHDNSTGCFRCHDDEHKAKDESTISGDCDYCHREIERPEAK